MKEFLNKKILVTGGTGSFGNKLIETLLKYNIKFKSLIVYSSDEFKQYNMNIKFNRKKIKYIIGDVRDRTFENASKDVDY